MAVLGEHDGPGDQIVNRVRRDWRRSEAVYALYRGSKFRINQSVTVLE